MTIGVLALQGDVREHTAAFADLGESTRAVRRPSDLAGLSGIVLPGGESTTLSLLLESSGLVEPLTVLLQAGWPVFGTCAGMILLATDVRDGRPDQRSFGVIDLTVRRNGYGRQAASFECDLEVSGIETSSAEVSRTAASSAEVSRTAASSAEVSRTAAFGIDGADDGPMHAIFIRAPVVDSCGPAVDVLATLPAASVGAGSTNNTTSNSAEDGFNTPGTPRPVACRQGPVLVTAFHPELTRDRRFHRLFVTMTKEGRL